MIPNNEDFLLAFLAIHQENTTAMIENSEELPFCWSHAASYCRPWKTISRGHKPPRAMGHAAYLSGLHFNVLRCNFLCKIKTLFLKVLHSHFAVYVKEICIMKICWNDNLVKMLWHKRIMPISIRTWRSTKHWRRSKNGRTLGWMNGRAEICNCSIQWIVIDYLYNCSFKQWIKVRLHLVSFIRVFEKVSVLEYP